MSDITEASSPLALPPSRPWWQVLLPCEWVIVSGVCALLLAHYLSGSPFFPLGDFARTVFGKYFILPALVLYLIRRAMEQLPFRFLDESRLPSWEEYARVIIAFSIGSYICHTFKLWSHLWHESYYDDTYQAIDLFLSPVLHAFDTANAALGFPHANNLMYITLFMAMFWACIPFSYVAGRETFLRFSTAVTVNMVLGGMAYCIAPAYGPFIYDEMAGDMQTYMLKFTESFHATAGASYEDKNFVFALGAMPSLHASFAITFFWCLWRTHKIFGIVFLPLMAFHLMNATLTRYHYLADIAAGALIATVAILIAEYSTPPRKRST